MDAYRAALSRSQRLIIVRGRKALDTAQSVKKTDSLTQGFEARAAYDAQNLYLRYDVTCPSELVNGITEPKLLFKGGNCLDIQIAASPAADSKRKTPTFGDVRILVTRQAGKPYAVIYRPEVAGFKGDPIVLNSPTGEESFDAIDVIGNGIALDYRKTPNSPVFTAVVTIPLALLNLKLEAGAKLRMDLGYIYGNSQGTKATRRAYWTNNGFSANVLDDVPNESRLEPSLWGNAEIE